MGFHATKTRMESLVLNNGKAEYVGTNIVVHEDQLRTWDARPYILGGLSDQQGRPHPANGRYISLREIAAVLTRLGIHPNDPKWR